MQTPTYEPLSDVSLSDEEALKEHRELINQYKYTEAVEKVNSDALLKKGFRASFFNTIQSKIQELQIYLLNKNASPDELYSLTEPTEEEMEGKVFWIKPIE